MSDKQRDYWSECGQVFFLDGYGWGSTEKGHRICLGSEEDILRFFKTGELNGDLHPKQKEELSWVLEYRKEQGYGTLSGTAGMERASDTRTSGYRQKKTRQLENRKGVALLKAQRKDKSLFRR